MNLNVSTNFPEGIIEVTTEAGIIQLYPKDALFVAQLLIEKSLNLMNDEI